MTTMKTTLVASVGSLALVAAVALPVVGAAPTYSGTLYCVRAGSEPPYYDNLITFGGDDSLGATRREISYWRKAYTENGWCVKGSVDTSQLYKDE